MSENPWKPTSRIHPPADLLKPITGPSAWTREVLEENKSYLYRLSEGEIGDIFDAVEKVESASPQLHEIGMEDFFLPVLGPVLKDLREEVIKVRGFVFLRGLQSAGHRAIEGRTLSAALLGAVWHHVVVRAAIAAPDPAMPGGRLCSHLDKL